MDALTPTSVVHFYDTQLHRILCGVRGFEQRSTKHARSVTCRACVGLLGKQPAMPAPREQLSSAGEIAP